MPRRNRIFMKALLPLGLLAVAVLAVFRRKPDEWEYEVVEASASAAPADPPAPAAAARRKPAARFALAAAFTTLFFAGAAFTAGAGDQAVRLTEEDASSIEDAQNVELAPEDAGAPAESAAPEAVAPEAAPEQAAPEAAPVEEPAAAEPEPEAVTPAETVEAAPAPAAESASPEAANAAEPAEQPAAPASAPAGQQPAPAARAVRQAKPAAHAPAKVAKKPATAKSAPATRPDAPPAPAPEIEHEHGDHPTVWLNRVLPDPTPASARLARGFAKQLKATAKRHDADWATVLGVLRAQGKRGAAPASRAELDALAAQVAGKDAWKAALALTGRTAFADQAEALADLYRWVGVQTLVTGYAKSKDRLAKRLLEHEGVLIYAGGREDVEAGRIDVRVLVLLGYLAKRHESVTVSSLFSGHRMFARPGVVSAHIYGHAVDIAAVGGSSIYGNSRPGGLTEEAVRSVLLLPAELQPRQVISLLGLGGPSFPMRDHGDHIHVGF